MQFTKLNSLAQNVNLSALVSDNALWIALFAGMIIFILSACIYSYHWRNYGTNTKLMRRIETLYIVVGIVLICLTAIMIKFR